MSYASIDVFHHSGIFKSPVILVLRSRQYINIKCDLLGARTIVRITFMIQSFKEPGPNFLFLIFL